MIEPQLGTSCKNISDSCVSLGFKSSHGPLKVLASVIKIAFFYCASTTCWDGVFAAMGSLCMYSFST